MLFVGRMGVVDRSTQLHAFEPLPENGDLMPRFDYSNVDKRHPDDGRRAKTRSSGKKNLSVSYHQDLSLWRFKWRTR
jgi:hypothetical protein